MTDNNADETAANSKLSRRTALGLMGTSAVGGAAATSAFSKLTADRPIDVEVVSSGGDSQTADSGSSELTIANNSGSTLDAQIETTNWYVTLNGLTGTSSASVSGTNPSWTLTGLGSGETATILFERPDGTANDDFNVTAFTNTNGFGVSSTQTVSLAEGLNSYSRDDWDDGKLTSRNNSLSETYNGVSGTYRPEWTNPYSETSAASVTNGKLKVDSGDVARADINLDLNKDITWKWDLDLSNFPAETGSNWTTLHCFAGSSSFGWEEFALSDAYAVAIRGRSGGSTFLRIDSDGPSGLTTFDVPLTQTEIKVTRSSSGEWEVFVDGSSVTTVTDTTHTTATYTGVMGRAGQNIDLRVDKYRVY